MEDNLLFKRLIRKYKFLNEELEDIKDEMVKLREEFNTTLSEMGFEFPQSSDEPVKETTQENYPILDKRYKKLFRKIVVKCHPDKLSEDISDKEAFKLKEMYEEVVEAMKIGNPTPLLIHAITLRLDVKEFQDDLKNIMESCGNIEKEINALQSSAAWCYNAVADEDKHIFMERYIKKYSK